MDEDIRERILEKLSAKEIAEEIEELDTDDVLTLETAKIGRNCHVSNYNSDHVEDIRELLHITKILQEV